MSLHGQLDAGVFMTGLPYPCSEFLDHAANPICHGKLGNLLASNVSWANMRPLYQEGISSRRTSPWKPVAL
jgi:hypothetical protein